MLCRLINSAWSAGFCAAERRFTRDLQHPRQAQQRILQQRLTAQHATAFGKAHRFDPSWSVSDFQSRVPMGDYASHAPYIERIRAGEPNQLTHEPVTHLIPTSGSTGARKLIPYTASLKRQFDAALGPWVRSMFRRCPAAGRGRAYWSVSPMIQDDLNSAVPIGFEDDTAYLGPIGRRLVGRVLAVPSTVRHTTDMEAFWRTTLRHLLMADDLALVSVWHPSFMSLLLDRLVDEWDGLLAKLPKRRAAQLARVDPGDVGVIWPGLALVSAWSDASSALAFDRLAKRLPSDVLEPKGILATECWTTIPYRGAYPLAVGSHFFEFIDDAGRARLCDELAVGETYETVVTTAGGLYRYRTGDRVRVTGHLDATPTLTFVGRGAATSDLCGEKLSEAHVAEVLASVYRAYDFYPDDQVLGAEGASAPTRYVLIVTSDRPMPAALSAGLDERLRENPHYDLARRLGQLQAVEAVRLERGAALRPGASAVSATSGTALGAVKPALLVQNVQIRRALASRAGLACGAGGPER